jgi:hypothetical protein
MVVARAFTWLLSKVSQFFKSFSTAIKIAVALLAPITAPFILLYEIAKRVKKYAVGSSLLHLGEAGMLAAQMISRSLLPVLEEVGKPRVATISATAGAPVSAVRAASSVSRSAAVGAAIGSAAASAPAAARGAGGKRTVEIVVPISLTLDGRTIAQVVQRVFCEEDALGFGPLRFAPGMGG